MISKQDRYHGALVGVLAGDALLAPYETWNSARIIAGIEKRGGLVPHDYPDPWIKDGIFPAGRPTDDSDQTAALAESLIANRGLNEEDLFNRLRTILHEHKSPLWEGRAVGAGKTSRAALQPETYMESQARPHTDEYPSNGALMRSAPLALYLGYPYRIDGGMLEKACRVTHRHPIASECALLYVCLLTSLLNGDSVPSRMNAHIPGLPRILDGDIEEPKDPGKWPARGNAAHTLHVALWATLRAKDFRDGLTMVARIGGDTDTNGAVAGGLLGAKFGIQGIPEEWQKVLKGRDIMIDLADKLYTLAHE